MMKYNEGMLTAHKPIIIGITGYLGSGKDTVSIGISQYIHNNTKSRVHRIALADELKKEVHTRILEKDGIPLEHLYDRSTKERYRAILQWWGTEWRRKDDPDYWLKRVIEVVEQLPNDVSVVTIPDIRFENECQFIQKEGGIVVRVNRPNLKTATAEHHSTLPPLESIISSERLQQIKTEIYRDVLQPEGLPEHHLYDAEHASRYDMLIRWWDKRYDDEYWMAPSGHVSENLIETLPADYDVENNFETADDFVKYLETEYIPNTLYPVLRAPVITSNNHIMETKPSCLVCDIDGVVVDSSHRLFKYVDFQAHQEGRIIDFIRSFTKYSLTTEGDKAIPEGIQMLHDLVAEHDPDEVFFLTSRGDLGRKLTLKWIRDNIFPGFSSSRLIMNRHISEINPDWDGNKTDIISSVDYKRKEIKKLQAVFNVLMALDDTEEIVDMYREEQVPALLVKHEGIDLVTPMRAAKL